MTNMCFFWELVHIYIMIWRLSYQSFVSCLWDTYLPLTLYCPSLRSGWNTKSQTDRWTWAWYTAWYNKGDSIQRVPQLFERPEFFHVNKSCKIECCGNKTHQIIQNMILSWGLELKLSLLWRTTISGQHSLFSRWGKVNLETVSYFDKFDAFCYHNTQFCICKIKNTDLR